MIRHLHGQSKYDEREAWINFVIQASKQTSSSHASRYDLVQRSPDNLCMFLAQTQTQLMQLLKKKASWHLKRSTFMGKLIHVMRTAISQSSSICDQSRLQLMALLKQVNIF
jgi:hypothetical protein